MIHYILQLVFFQLLFLLAYDFFLKKETFFSYNRWYLLITPLISLVLPFLEFDGLAQMAPSGSTILLPEVFIGAAPQETVPADAKPVESGLQLNWWWIIYSLGSLISSILFFRKYSALKELFQHPMISEGKGCKVIGVADSSVACTFYRTIFLGDRLSETEKQQVLSHELVHVRQKHTLDLLYFEVQKIIFWFNPLIYIFQSRIATLHEFIADAGVVKTTEKKMYYQQLLNTAFSTKNISFINQFFNHSLIKKRIIMLQKSKSKTVSKLKYLILVPLMLVMLTYVACSENSTSIVKEAAEPETVPLSEIVLNNYSDNSEGKATDVPSAGIEEVFDEKCDNLSSNEAREACTTEKIRRFINDNFNISLTQDLGLSGINRIYLQFRINSNGIVEVLGVRAPHVALEDEARRVINSLPKMVSGKEKGGNVGMLYTLPITFMVPE